jgi:hypothetical protein
MTDLLPGFEELEPKYECKHLMFWDGEWEGPFIVRVLARAKPAQGIERIDAAGRKVKTRPAPRNVLVELVYPQCYPGWPTRWTRPARGLRRRR